MRLSPHDEINILKHQVYELKRIEQLNKEKFKQTTRHTYIQYVILFVLSFGIMLLFLYNMQ